MFKGTVSVISSLYVKRSMSDLLLYILETFIWSKMLKITSFSRSSLFLIISPSFRIIKKSTFHFCRETTVRKSSFQNKKHGNLIHTCSVSRVPYFFYRFRGNMLSFLTFWKKNFRFFVLKISPCSRKNSVFFHKQSNQFGGFYSVFIKIKLINLMHNFLGF